MVPGPFSLYMTPQETSLLVALVRSVDPRTVIEFGCNQGLTARRLLDNISTIERYIGVDVPPDHDTVLECQRSEVPELAGVHAIDDRRFELLLVPTSELSIDDLEPCDAVFIDGDHSHDAVIHESLLARKLLRMGGIIVWHDYGNPAVEVTRAVDRLRDDGWVIDSVENSWLAFTRRLA